MSAKRTLKRPIGQRVRISSGGRYHGTVGTVCEHVPAFGGIYRVESSDVIEDGQLSHPADWKCLCFPDELRSAKPAEPTQGDAK